ncbi:MAG: hypothetical protein JST40_08440 [Armatimonadetes bacterium]|nr:hypothetical protein [Armatimonadota bacterium]
MKHRKHSGHSRLRRGATMVEVVTGAGLTTIVLGTSLSILIAGNASWARGSGQISADSSAQTAIRILSSTLREAMTVTVDENGQGLTYRLPEVDEDGNYVVPAVWDGVTHRVYYDDGFLYEQTGDDLRTIAREVILTDPARGNARYRIFTPGDGTVIRSLTISVVTQTNGQHNAETHSRAKETLYLRNVPSLTQ